MQLSRRRYPLFVSANDKHELIQEFLSYKLQDRKFYYNLWYSAILGGGGGNYIVVMKILWHSLEIINVRYDEMVCILTVIV